jgi:hypothetical protein
MWPPTDTIRDDWPIASVGAGFASCSVKMGLAMNDPLDLHQPTALYLCRNMKPNVVGGY